MTVWDVTTGKPTRTPGVLPIKIEALPEGSLAAPGTCLFKLTNTHPRYFWLPSTACSNDPTALAASPLHSPPESPLHGFTVFTARRTAPPRTAPPHKPPWPCSETARPRPTDFLETLLVQVWYPTTVATQTREFRKTIQVLLLLILVVTWPCATPGAAF